MQPNELDILLTKVISNTVGVTDFVLVAGKRPQINVEGRLHSFDAEPLLTTATINRLAELVLSTNPNLQQDLTRTGSCDCSYAIKGGARFRVNLYRQNATYAMVLRRLPSTIPSLEELNLPTVLKEATQAESGLIFITGGAGSGKTTTVAAMLNEINCRDEVHVVTLEDPIEFLHPQHVATFSQRELGRDFFSFPEALKAALRQLPKVIFIGEIRDRATMDLALTAAETGYLVCSTMHTVNAAQTISRIVALYDKEEEAQVRERLSETVRYIVSQRLVAGKTSGRFLATEVMGNNRRTREVIALGENENRRYVDIIEAGENLGWHSFEQCLLHAYCQHLVSEETAVAAATNKAHMRQMIDNARKQQEGLQVTETIKMKEEVAEAPVTLEMKSEAAPAEPIVETFLMSCPKCAAAAELPVSYYDFLVECPSCKETVLARPIESQEMLTEATNAMDLISMPPISAEPTSTLTPGLFMATPAGPAPQPPVPRMTNAA